MKILGMVFIWCGVEWFYLGNTLQCGNLLSLLSDLRFKVDQNMGSIITKTFSSFNNLVIASMLEGSARIDNSQLPRSYSRYLCQMVYFSLHLFFLPGFYKVLTSVLRVQVFPGCK